MCSARAGFVCDFFLIFLFLLMLTQGKWHGNFMRYKFSCFAHRSVIVWRLRHGRTVALAATIHTSRTAQHPINLVDEALLWFPLRLQYLPAQIEKGFAHLLYLLGSWHFVEFAVKIFRENLTLVGWHLPEMNQVRLIALIREKRERFFLRMKNEIQLAAEGWARGAAWCKFELIFNLLRSFTGRVCVSVASVGARQSVMLTYQQHHGCFGILQLLFQLLNEIEGISIGDWVHQKQPIAPAECFTLRWNCFAIVSLRER